MAIRLTRFSIKLSQIVLGLTLVPISLLPAIGQTAFADNDEIPRVIFKFGDTTSATTSLALADFNGDGVKDFILNAYNPNDGSEDGYIIFNAPNLPPAIDLSQPLGNLGIRITNSSISPYRTPAQAVSRVVSVGDLNHDGKDDILVSTQIDGNQQEYAYLIWGENSPQTIDEAGILPSQGVRFGDFSATNNVILDMANVGDVNGDGRDDLALGDFTASAGRRSTYSEDGQVHVIYGQAEWPATIDLNNLTPDQGFQINGKLNSNTGESVAKIGDFNGDGLADIAFTALDDEVTYLGNGQYQITGAVYVVYGSSTRNSDVDLTNLGGSGVRMYTNKSLEHYEENIVEVGDVNDDGLADLSIASADGSIYTGSNDQIWTVYGKTDQNEINLDNIGSAGTTGTFDNSITGDWESLTSDDTNLYTGDGLATNTNGAQNAGVIYAIPRSNLNTISGIPSSSNGYSITGDTANMHLGSVRANESVNGELLSSVGDGTTSDIAVVIPAQSGSVSLTPRQVDSPTNLSAVVSGTDVNLSWDNIDNVSHYNVYRDRILVGTSNTNNYTDQSVSAGSHTYHVTSVEGTDESGPSSDVDAVVDSLPVFTSPSQAIINARDMADVEVTSSGVPNASITENGVLPDGIVFTDNGDGTATFSGQASPVNNGIYIVTLVATNDAGTANQTFALSVNNAQTVPTFVDLPSTITETYGRPFDLTFTTTGNPIPNISKTGTMPNGATFHDNNDGTFTISGSIRGAATSGSKTITLKAKNKNGTVTQDVNIVWGPGSGGGGAQ